MRERITAADVSYIGIIDEYSLTTMLALSEPPIDLQPWPFGPTLMTLK